MDIQNRKVLILGGFGMVGQALLRELAAKKPAELIIASLLESEARAAVKQITEEAPGVKATPVWGNVFLRVDLKDLQRHELLENAEYRNALIADAMEPMDEEILARSTVHQIISHHKPNIIIDAVNSATGLAYQNVYRGYYRVREELTAAVDQDQLTQSLVVEVEKLLASLYIPQLIRHTQIMYESMRRNKTRVYLKIGTSGTGGMGLNIPYTHSEEKPSRVLLSKTALAGAQTLLLFLMGRTPDAPITKEIKPAAAIAWKSINYGPITKHGQPIPMVDCHPDNALQLTDTFDFASDPCHALDRNMESVYIDTGENGIFSLWEFECITAVGQMEFVTPEEIAQNAIMEIEGDNTGHDIINALDNAIMGPTYRAGSMRHRAINHMERLVKEHDQESVAFELLGPPRLSKLLHESNLLRQTIGSLEALATAEPADLVQKVEQLITENQQLRSSILSIGVPILMSDGKQLLRGATIAIPASLGRASINMSAADKDNWAKTGWVDLRLQNFVKWQARAIAIIAEADSIPANDTSSQFHHNVDYWDIEAQLNPGKVVAWIFINEEEGAREKR